MNNFTNIPQPTALLPGVPAKYIPSFRDFRIEKKTYFQPLFPLPRPLFRIPIPRAVARRADRLATLAGLIFFPVFLF